MPQAVPFADLQQRRRQLDVTEDMLAQIRRVTDTDISADDIVVFEAAAVNTLPLNKAGSIFAGARISRLTLEQMAQAVNSGEESVPMHTLHMQGEELPVGKVFSAYLYDLPNGETELRAQFYLPKSERELVEKINLGVLDEVSVGLKSKQLLCSKCGWDYFGEEADFMNLLMQTCENDHVIGVDGAHAKLVGMDKWMELSLVSRGAAEKPKILSRTKSLMPQETQDRIAASGFVPEATVLFASPTKLKEEAPMAELDNQAADEAVTPEADEATVPVDLSSVEAKLDQLIDLLTAQETEEPEEEQNSELEALRAEVASLTEVVANLSAPKAEDLAPDLPEGGVAASAIADAGKTAVQAAASAFKSRRN